VLVLGDRRLGKQKRRGSWLDERGCLFSRHSGQGEHRFMIGKHGNQTMRRSQQFLSQLAFASVIAAGAASASPAFAAPPMENKPAIERIDWGQRCWWVDSPWGQEQRCRRVWIQPRHDDYDPGWGRDQGYNHEGEDWEHRDRQDWHDDD
jgi:hypothetical protein